MGPEDRDDEAKGFLEEVFEHRQSQPAPEPVEGADDAADEVAALTDAGDDHAVHSGVAPEPGAPGGSGVAVEDLRETVDAVGATPQATVRELDPSEKALVDEAMKKSGIVWLDAGSRPIAQPAWYVWLEGAAYVLTGAGEQPDPGLAQGASVGVFARSKETRSLLVEWVGSASKVLPTDQSWEVVAAALAKARLNLPDPATAPRRWAADPAIAIFQITPIGPLPEAPGAYSDSSRRAAPIPTPAATAGAPPKVIHRRKTARRPLS